MYIYIHHKTLLTPKEFEYTYESQIHQKTWNHYNYIASINHWQFWNTIAVLALLALSTSMLVDVQNIPLFIFGKISLIIN